MRKASSDRDIERHLRATRVKLGLNFPSGPAAQSVQVSSGRRRRTPMALLPSLTWINNWLHLSEVGHSLHCFGGLIQREGATDHLVEWQRVSRGEEVDGLQ